MKRINEQKPKAFIGAAISVGTSIVSGIIGNRKKKKAEQAERLRQERLQNLQNHQALASAQNESMMSEEDRTQFLSQYLSKGGGVKTSPRKEVKARIVEGGTAIPIKKDSFLLKGRKHNAGGIVIDAGKTGVEAEGGEVVQVTPKQLKVFSAQPILNGNSPAELVQKGVEPSKVFNAQESFKDKNGLNDDGTKKKKVMGGKDKFGNKLAESSKSQIMQRIPKYNKLNINRGTFNGGKGSGGGAGTKFNYSDDIIEINVVGSRIPKMINDNTFVPGRYPNSSNNVTTPRESTSTSLYKGIKSMLGVPNRKKSALGSKTKLLKDNYNNFGLEKDYSNSFTPNALTKANMNSVKTNSVVPTKPIGASISSSTSPLSKSGGFKNFMSGIGGEAISAGIGALGNIISGVTNKNSINNIQAPTRPRTVVPARMRTTYNINPQLAESRDSERNIARLIDSNTSSSSGKIARIQSIANRGILERNKLRGMKENVETDLLNRSALNRQGVEAANNQVLNAYDNAVTQTENEKIQARANNRTNVIEGLTSAVRDYQLGVDKRRSEENATAAMMSANPEQMELFLKLMNKNKGRLSNIRSTLFKCGGKKKIA